MIKRKLVPIIAVAISLFAGIGLTAFGPKRALSITD